MWTDYSGQGAYILVHIERSNVLSGVNLKGGLLVCVKGAYLQERHL